ncbi:MAG: hypothetical protein AB4206_07150 [Xenococcaceae cyanobacterium]
MIAINELSPSYITEMEANEVDSIFGGLLELLNPPSFPDTTTTIAFTPLGGTPANIEEAFANALAYAGTGVVSEAVVGGNFSFLGTQLFPVV